MELLCNEKRLIPVPGMILKLDDLTETLRRCTGDSVHTYLPQLCKGYATARGGHRFGICGEAVHGPEGITGFRTVTSINIRVARQVLGVAEPLAQYLLAR